MLGDAAEGQFAQHRQHRRPKRALQRAQRRLRTHDQPVTQPLLELGGNDVDQFDLVGGVECGVIHNRRARVAIHQRPHGGNGALQVADVHGGDDGDAGGPDHGDHVGDQLACGGVAGEVVHRRNLWIARQQGRQVDNAARGG